MKYSVIVPYWNSEKWLSRCCESLTKQKGDFEFIFVDDMSEDEGAKIVCDYRDKDNRFVSLYNTRTKGVSGARNTGIKWASGEWITFLDADDEMLGDAENKFDSAINDDKKAKIHQFNHLRYYNSINKTALKYANDGGRYYIDNLPDCWYGVWNKLFSANLIKNTLFNEELQYGEDGLFVLECMTKTNTIHHAERSLTVVRRHFDNKDSLSHVKKGEDLIKHFRAYEEFLLRQKDPKIRVAVCKMLSDLWGAQRCINLIGKG